MSKPNGRGRPDSGGASAALGFTTLSRVLFGLYITSFVVLASIISLRLYVELSFAAGPAADNRDPSRARRTSPTESCHPCAAL